MKKLIIYSDGGARGNPGPAGIGCVLKNEAGDNVVEIYEYIGKTTNNQAEYKAILAGVEKAKEMEPGFRYFHVHSPCPTGWRFPENKTIEIARLAVETGFWTLYEIDHGSSRITYRPPNRRPIEDYIKLQGRFKELREEDIRTLQKWVDERWDNL